ncbi:hypothetical protein CWT00_26920 [Klebsiella sp. CVUAS 8534.2]|nr:hypothetical protein [Klebsiella sp. CVUAS 8534.2]
MFTTSCHSRAIVIGEREGWRKLKAGGVNVTTKTGLRATLADRLQRSGNGEVWHRRNHQSDKPLQHNYWWRGCRWTGEAYQAGTV